MVDDKNHKICHSNCMELLITLKSTQNSLVNSTVIFRKQYQIGIRLFKTCSSKRKQEDDIYEHFSYAPVKSGTFLTID